MRAILLLAVIGALITLPGCALAGPGAKSVTSEPISGLCYLCFKPINGHGRVQADLGRGGERSYRCIECALYDVGKSPVLVVIRAQSLVSGRTIRLFVQNLAPWTADPPDPVFLMLDEKDGRCTDYHQVFVDHAEFDRYVGERAELSAQNPQPLTLAQVALRANAKRLQ